MKTKSIGKRLLAVLLTVCMMFSVITVGASAAVIAPTIERVEYYGPAYPGLPSEWSSFSGAVWALYRDPSNSDDIEIFTLKKVANADAAYNSDLGMRGVNFNGQWYKHVGIWTVPPSEIIDKADGHKAVTVPLYFVPESEKPTAGSKVSIAIYDNKSETYSNPVEVTVPEDSGKSESGGSTETWVKRYNATTHWDECVEGEQVGTKKNVEKHNFSTAAKVLSIEIPGDFNILYPLSEVNTPILSDTEGNKYSFSGCGFHNTVQQASGEATTRNYYFSHIQKPEGATDEYFVVNGYECTECGYFMFGEVGMGRIMQLEDEAFGVAVDAPVAMYGQRLTFQVANMTSNPAKARIPKVSTASGMPVPVFHKYRESISPELDADEPVTELRVPSPSPEDTVLIDVYEYDMPGEGVSVTLERPTPVSSLKITASSAEVTVDGNVVVGIETDPEGVDPDNFIWETGDDDIATVSNTGVITGVDTGKTTVTVTGYTPDGEPISATIPVIVTDGDEPYIPPIKPVPTPGGSSGSSTSSSSSSSSADTSNSKDSVKVNASLVDGNIVLDWKKPQGTSGAVVYAKKTGEKEFSVLAKTKKNKLTILNAKNNTTYEFKLAFTYGGVENDYGGKYSTKLSVYYKPAPKATTGDGTVVLRWKAVKDATEYMVCEVKNNKVVKIATTEKTSVRLRNVKSGKTYKFAVKAKVNGKWTNVKNSDIITIKVK